MSLLTFNNDLTSTLEVTKDVLSVFRQSNDKKITIRQGMSISEISEVVSEKIINVVKEQFEITKEDFETKTVKK
ncbi:hypothetical protein RCH18_001366 [Flavobacterium sp. PL11]|jgi:hypothetical protein|uniref:hypothetical protein n=1 Tax=Flavobacterium sp. PL11 TaxID=3071717 RepID=UPI002E0770D4|nr:hypothetical protein [Flavobacterium sp. PL11]